MIHQPSNYFEIPWTETTLPIYYESMPVVYSCGEQLELSRDPTNYLVDDPDDPQPVDKWILPLTYERSAGRQSCWTQGKVSDFRFLSARLSLCFQDTLPSVSILYFIKRLALSSYH